MKYMMLLSVCECSIFLKPVKRDELFKICRIIQNQADFIPLHSLRMKAILLPLQHQKIGIFRMCKRCKICIVSGVFFHSQRQRYMNHQNPRDGGKWFQ